MNQVAIEVVDTAFIVYKPQGAAAFGVATLILATNLRFFMVVSRTRPPR